MSVQLPFYCDFQRIFVNIQQILLKFHCTETVRKAVPDFMALYYEVIIRDSNTDTDNPVPSDVLYAFILEREENGVSGEKTSKHMRDQLQELNSHETRHNV